MRLIIRVDGDASMGTGHVMRCIALAEAWRRAGEVEFLCARLAPGLASELARRSLNATVLHAPPGGEEDGKALRQAAREVDWVVLDGYHLPPDFQDLPSRVAVIDDGGRYATPQVDLVADPVEHPYEAGTVMAGPQYALVREEFRRARPNQPPRPPRRLTLLVSLGGAAPPRLVDMVAAGLEGTRATFVLGPDQPDRGKLAARVQQHGHTIASTGIASAMAAADAAILAGGATNWEACCLGLPRAIIRTAANQADNTERLVSAGAAIDLGWHEDVTVAAVAASVDCLAEAAMAEAAWRLVDGRGARRIVAAMQAACLDIRPAAEEDARRVFEWANDAETRAQSFHPEPIAWPEHQSWFQRRLQSEAYILSREEPFAFAWFDEDDTISINLAPAARGRGLGAPAIVAATRRHGASRALIKRGNHASEAAFSDADYHRVGDETVNGQPASLWVHS